MFRNDPGKYGWCGITNNLVDGKTKAVEVTENYQQCFTSCVTYSKILIKFG